MTPTKSSFEAFTRLKPAPDVQIDKEKFSTVLRLTALRVPKVSTRCFLFTHFLVLPAKVRFRAPHTNPTSLLPPPLGRSPRFVVGSTPESDGPIMHRVAGQVPVRDEGAEGTRARHAQASLRHERPAGA